MKKIFFNRVNKLKYKFQTLASLHACSLCYKLKQPEEFMNLVSPLTENIFPADEDATGFAGFFENGINYALFILESSKSDSPETEKSINFLKSYQGKMVDSMRRMLIPRPEDDRYRVITHGDTWNNNILFLHDAKGKVVQVKLVDFQVKLKFLR